LYLIPVLCKKGRVYKKEEGNRLEPDARSEKIAVRSKAGKKPGKINETPRRVSAEETANRL
jgi:hypothetical protein